MKEDIKMKNILAALAITLVSSAHAMGEMPPGPHTQARQFFHDFTLAPHSMELVDYEVIPYDNTTVWTDIQTCLEISRNEIDRDPSTDKVRLGAWLKNMDEGSTTYYHITALDTWKDKSCTEVEHFSNPVHVQHNLRVSHRLMNYGDNTVIYHTITNIFAK